MAQEIVHAAIFSTIIRIQQDREHKDLLMLIGDPQDGFFYPTLILMIDSYNLKWIKATEIPIWCAAKVLSVVVAISDHTYLHSIDMYKPSQTQVQAPLHYRKPFRPITSRWK